MRNNWTTLESRIIDHGTRDWYEYGWENTDMSSSGGEWEKGNRKISISPNTVYRPGGSGYYEFGKFEVRVDGRPHRGRFFDTPVDALMSVADIVYGKGKVGRDLQWATGEWEERSSRPGFKRDTSPRNPSKGSGDALARALEGRK